MRLYADSSFLVSCYLMDANTAQVKTYLSGRNVSLIITALHEFASFDARQHALATATGLRDVLASER